MDKKIIDNINYGLPNRQTDNKGLRYSQRTTNQTLLTAVLPNLNTDLAVDVANAKILLDSIYCDYQWLAVPTGQIRIAVYGTIAINNQYVDYDASSSNTGVNNFINVGGGRPYATNLNLPINIDSTRVLPISFNVFFNTWTNVGSVTIGDQVSLTTTISYRIVK